MDEYISKEAAKSLMRIAQSGAIVNCDIVELLDKLPTADVAPVRHGRWIDMGDFVQCSCCTCTMMEEFRSFYGIAMRNPFPSYCPHCGADMRGDTE